MPNADALERRTAEFVEMLRQLRGGDPFDQEAFRAARAALESADGLLGEAASIVERVVFRDTHVGGWHAGTVLEAARFDVASARRRIRAVLDAVEPAP